jgi:hypothetical protein
MNKKKTQKKHQPKPDPTYQLAITGIKIMLVFSIIVFWLIEIFK